MTKNKVTTDLPDNLPAPARRALAAGGYTKLKDLTHVSEEELLELHGMGPNAIAKLREALSAVGRSFADHERS